jgi:hypothetical protein
MATAIAGWAHTPFSKYDNESVESLIVRVTNEALAQAGVSAADVDEIVLGHFNAGFWEFTAAQVLQADPQLRFKPAVHVGWSELSANFSRKPRSHKAHRFHKELRSSRTAFSPIKLQMTASDNISVDRRRNVRTVPVSRNGTDCDGPQ